MVNLNNIYNYYSSQLAIPKNYSKPQSHEKDDLKTVYKNMVKQNQSSPFYKFAFPDSTQAYAIGIKEAAMQLDSQSQSLGNHEDSIFQQMTAVSSNENVILASMNSNDTDGLPDQLSIEIQTLAKGQTNVGNYLPSGELSLEPGSYSFGIAVGQNEYTFNLNIHSGDTNLDIQRNLASSINDNNIGIRANIRNNRVDGTSALVLRSEAVGQSGDSELLFHFDESYLENDISSFLGVNQVETAPTNAQFTINGDFHSSISNRISLNHSIDLDLLSETEEPITISLVPDEEKISDQLDDFLQSYNRLVDISRNGSSQKGATRLFRDVTNVARHHQKELTAAGIQVDENGYLSKTEEVDNGKIQVLFDEKNSAFRRDLKRTTEHMTLNPLEYIDKTVVTYPNTKVNYPNPYEPSKYSGLLYNDYA
ncbi:MAG: flagellar filament capping protein FliD [Eubacteriales bacterium]|nr:flagellar filament capping protein FliD [Eubacteriales bacterium]